MELKLTDAEIALVAPFFAATDAAKQAYVQGLEIAKTLLVQQIVASRKEPINDPLNTAGPTQHASAPPASNAAPNGHA